MTSRRIRAIVLHHAAAQVTLEQIERDHAGRGWGVGLASGAFVATGYHYVIEADGTLRLGRPEAVVGAHAKPRNSDTIGVCMAVDGRHGVPEPCWRQTVALVRDLLARYGLNQANVHPHREISATACPGISDAEFNRFLLELG